MQLVIPKDRRCCAVVNGEQCPEPAKFFVGTNDVDDYTEVCQRHIPDVERVGDTVTEL